MKVVIRLAIVLVFLGLLASLIIPQTGSLVYPAPHKGYSAKMKQVAIAYNTYANSGARARSVDVSSPYDMAVFLARNVGLNDISYYLPDEVASSLKDTRILIEEGYMIDREIVENDIILEFASPLSVRSPHSTTPLLWLKGLGFDGLWDEDSPLEGKGGLVGYLDGHVEFFEKATFVKFGTKETTHDIREAVDAESKLLRNPAL